MAEIGSLLNHGVGAGSKARRIRTGFSAKAKAGRDASRPLRSRLILAPTEWRLYDPS